MKAMKKKIQFAALSVGVMLWSHSTPALAGVNHAVAATASLTFSPATLTINAGDSVTWSGLGLHTSTSGTVQNNVETPDGLWNSSTSGFTFTFNNAGTFNYYCQPHAVTFGMKGTITVNAAANVPPTVTITNPANGIILSAPASLTLKANAADADGSVTNVKFLQSTTSLGDVTAAPFSIGVNNLTAADYTFSAIANDNNGATATNSITVHVINPNPVTISAAAVATPGSFQFNYSADIGLTYVVQASTNLFDWVSLMTNTAAAGPVTFTDPNAGSAGAFYRVGRLSNP